MAYQMPCGSQPLLVMTSRLGGEGEAVELEAETKVAGEGLYRSQEDLRFQ